MHSDISLLESTGYTPRRDSGSTRTGARIISHALFMFILDKHTGVSSRMAPRAIRKAVVGFSGEGGGIL